MYFRFGAYSLVNGDLCLPGPIQVVYIGYHHYSRHLGNLCCLKGSCNSIIVRKHASDVLKIIHRDGSGGLAEALRTRLYTVTLRRPDLQPPINLDYLLGGHAEASCPCITRQQRLRNRAYSILFHCVPLIAEMKFLICQLHTEGCVISRIVVT